MTGRILQQKGPVSYLVRVGSKIRYCHVDHLLKSNVISEGNAEVVHDHKRDTRSADFFMPIDNDREPNVEPTVTSAVPQQSARIRQPPKRLIEEMNN